ncbi:MAG: DUF4339 domain-containing protein [Bacteroidota bacterium]
MESQQFFLIRQGERVGPYTREELKTQVKSRNDIIWSEQLVYWTPLNKIIDLADVCQAIPPDYVEENTESHSGFNLSEWIHRNYKVISVVLVLFIGYMIFIEVPRRNALIEKEQAIVRYEKDLHEKELQRIEQMKEQQKQAEIASARVKLSELNVALSMANDRYAQAKEFHFLRTPEERDRDLRNAMIEIERIEAKRNEVLKVINQ